MQNTQKSIVYVRASDIYNDSRAIKEIKSFIEAGYKIYILGWNKSGDALIKTKKSLGANNSDISLHFYNCSDGASIFKKLYGRAKWGKWLLLHLNTIEKKEKSFYLHVCDLDCGIPLRKYQNKPNVKFVYDIYDYYADSHSFNSLISSAIKRIEDSIVTNADLTIICTEERREQIKDAQPKRVIVIYNSPDISNNEDHEVDADYAYCGALDDGRMIGKIIAKYPSNNSLRFLFAGRGERESKVQSVSACNANFSYYGSITYEEVISIEKRARVLSAIYDPSLKNHRLCAPNKFYEALALGKPIIVCKGTGIDTVVKENNIGLVIDYDVDSFYSALKELSGNVKMCQAMGDRARRLYIEKYQWNNSKQMLLNTYSDMSI